jgi:hypothetical protein
VLFSPIILVLVAGAAGLVVWSAISADPSLRGQKGRIAGLLVFSMIYGWGITIEADTLFDRSSGTTFVASVEGKHMDTGKGTTYHLDLDAWGPKKSSNSLRVRPATYDAVRRGDSVNLVVKSGTLGIRWYYLRGWR